MTDQVDKILTHPILGIPAFFGIMALVFFLTFTVGDFLKGYFEQGLELAVARCFCPGFIQQELPTG